MVSSCHTVRRALDSFTSVLSCPRGAPVNVAPGKMSSAFASRRLALGLVTVGTFALLALALPSNGHGACYFVGGSCNYGYLAAGQTTPWTGDYVSWSERMQHNNAPPRTMTFGVRLCGTCPGVTYSTGGPVANTVILRVDGDTAVRQRWCRNAGGSGGTFLCYFY